MTDREKAQLRADAEAFDRLITETCQSYGVDSSNPATRVRIQGHTRKVLERAGFSLHSLPNDEWFQAAVRIAVKRIARRVER